MKKLFVLVITSLLTLGAFAQSSTEGKDFWVAVMFANAPDGNISHFEPFIAISAKKACTIQVSNPATGWSDQPRMVQANSWLVINNIPVGQWYNQSWTANSASEAVNPYGIRVQSTEEVSVYAAMRMEFSYDASNILPITALQSDYIIQDYPPYNSEGESRSIFSILATEDNTVVDITPTAATIGGRPAGVPFNITLNKGETYQVIGPDQVTLSGSRVTARGGKKIAVFNGDVFTQVPGGKSARDCLYEQAMPTDYWGREFVVTRSKEKDANRIRITAMEDGTQVNIDNYLAATLNAGETFECELSENLASGDMQSAITKIGRTVPPIYTGEAHYIHSSCPVAVYGYDVSSTYVLKSGSESIDGSPGDPSMVWISPLEQNISKITFGACGTSGSEGHTNRHYVNVVVKTEDVNAITLSSEQRPNIPMTFQPVPSKPDYSYARVFLVDTDGSNPDKIYTLTSHGNSGFIAHVYGSGKNESYAYSVGSSAVKRGIQVGNSTLEDGSVGVTTYCVNTAITFNAQVGTDIIDTAYWDMGDGVTFTDQSRISFNYTYDTPGWYDVTATVMAHKECPDTVYPRETVNVRIHVIRPDTIVTRKFICEGETLNYGGNTYTRDTTDTVAFACDSIVIFSLEVGKKTSYEFFSTERDSFVLAGKTYYKSGDYTATLTNAAGCDSLVTAHVTVLTCLDLVVSSPDAVICADEAEFRIPYVHKKGDIGDAYISNRGVKTPITTSALDDAFVIPLNTFKADHYTKASVIVEDPICGGELTFPVSFDVLYPSSVFNQKWDNTLVLYNKDYNGGYDFRAYQWYKNNMPIPGATGSYYVEEPLDTAAFYQVMLTRLDTATGELIQLLTCPYYPVVKNAHSPKAAEKVMENGEIYILKEGIKYSILGVAIKEEEK